MTHPARPRRTIAAPLALAALLLPLVAACGSTRFVVVETPPQGAVAPAAGAATAATPGAAVTASEPTEADAAAIAEAIDGALDLDERGLEDRLPWLVGADDIGPTLDSVRGVAEGLDVELVVDEVTVADDRATATMTVTTNGETFATGLPVELVRSGAAWKVTRAGACTLLAIASPCPETTG